MATSTFDRVFSFRTDLASRAAALSFTSNFALMVLKLTVGAMTGSIAVLSDGIDSAEDAIASTFAFISIRLASQPADEDHPYGHGKAEALAAAAQALLIAGGAAYIIFSATQRLIERDADIDTGPGMIALAITAAVNVAVVVYVGHAARVTGSVALRADERHLWTNVAQALAVVLALALVATTGHIVFDQIMALLLAVYLLWTAGHVSMAALGEIMDVRLPPEEEQLIERCIRECQDIRGYHDLRTRKAGRERYVDFHLLVDPVQTVGDAHHLVDEIERSIKRALPDAIVTIHLDPDDGRFRDEPHTSSLEMGDDSPRHIE